MNIDIDWQEPIQLTHSKTIIIDKDAPPQEIENRAGVYFFSRKFGKHYEPFYIGQTLTLRARLKSHLGTTKLDYVLRESDDANIQIKGGERYFHFGYYNSHSVKRTKKCIQIVEKYLVRTALAKNIKLLNKQLTAFKTDKLSFNGTAKARGIYAKKAVVEA
jgi:hypothetical protein